MLITPHYVMMCIVEYENARFLYDQYTVDPCQMLNLHMEGGWEERQKMLDKLNLWNKICLKETWNAVTLICSHNNRNWLDMLVLYTEAWILNEIL